MKAKPILVICCVLMLTGVIAACTGSEAPPEKRVRREEPRQPSSESGAPAAKSGESRETAVKLYFAEPSGDKLRPETRELDGYGDFPKAAMEALSEGPRAQDLRATLPEGTKVLGVEIRDEVAYVDFSNEFVANHPGGSSGELMTVYSVVSTLCDLPGIKRVSFKVEGKTIPLLKGQVDLTEPLSPDESLITGR